MFALGAFLACASATADWGPDNERALNELMREPVRFPNPTAATLWGGAQARKAANQPLTANATLSAQGIKCPLLIQKNGAKAKPARLLVYLPGMFNNLNDPLLIRGFNRFARLGHHLLTMPNPWSEDYIRSGAKTRPGEIELEAEQILRAIHEAVRAIGPRNVEGIDVAGDSDGAFLGAVTFAKDRESKAPILDGSLTLFGPPLHFDKALAAMDRRIDDSREKYFRDCSSKVQVVPILANLLSAPSQLWLNPHTLDCADSIFAFRAFQAFAVRAAIAIDETWNLGSIPTDAETWKRNLTFRGFLKNYSPGGLKTANDPVKADLGYWLNQSSQRGPLNLRILTSRDELVNEIADWSADPHFHFTEKNTRFVPWGGHLGWEALQDFDLVVRSAF